MGDLVSPCRHTVAHRWPAQTATPTAATPAGLTGQAVRREWASAGGTYIPGIPCMACTADMPRMSPMTGMAPMVPPAGEWTPVGARV